ncbi:hypothetical protein R3W88_033644 [Solanum pinnatisectum]|uniref:Endonuclease/exonuclease/phosphatase domain-containing protein n=1 Tax=Solanum pinnatisectum TaxID=50273 RepID=A0AAV9K0U5_9SOLN|nr:hypothetical protein R3W88_033644 [Solanum pinnatisectum]
MNTSPTKMVTPATGVIQKLQPLTFGSFLPSKFTVISEEANTMLSKVASAVGNPLHTDNFTGNAKKISYVRVNLDVLKSWGVTICSSMIICTWNIRGLNQDHKYKELKLFLTKHKLDIFGCLETRVKQPRDPQIMRKIAQGWKSCNNYIEEPNERIWVLWKPHLQVQIIEMKRRYIHCLVEDPGVERTLYVTIILWQELMQIKPQLQMPWVLFGDFNSVLGTVDKIGSPLHSRKAIGWHFTWCNKQEVENMVYSKIDWAFGNLHWIKQYRHVEADYLNPSISDHSPILIKCSQQ